MDDRPSFANRLRTARGRLPRFEAADPAWITDEHLAAIEDERTLRT